VPARSVYGSEGLGVRVPPSALKSPGQGNEIQRGEKSWRSKSVRRSGCSATSRRRSSYRGPTLEGAGGHLVVKVDEGRTVIIHKTAIDAFPPRIPRWEQDTKTHQTPHPLDR
jgi:hypothetical protein